MNDINKRVFEYYLVYNENDRLFKDKASKLEYDVATYYLNEMIKDNSLVLDTCAGPGAYIKFFSSKNVDVYASDLHPKHVSLLEQKKKEFQNLREVFLWDVCKPIGISKSFDTVLCMGALYHNQLNDWSPIITNCISFLKNDGVFIFTYLNRAAWILKGIHNEGIDLESINRIEETGGGPVFYAASPLEVESLLYSLNLKVRKHIALTGVKYLCENQINMLSDSEYNQFLKYHLKHCEDRDLLGYSQYCLVVATK